MAPKINDQRNKVKKPSSCMVVKLRDVFGENKNGVNNAEKQTPRKSERVPKNDAKSSTILMNT